MSLALGTIEDMKVVYRIELGRMLTARPELSSDEFEHAYTKYRKRGYGQQEAFDIATIYDRNMREQRRRRASHDTGYEDRYR